MKDRNLPAGISGFRNPVPVPDCGRGQSWWVKRLVLLVTDRQRTRAARGSDTLCIAVRDMSQAVSRNVLQLDGDMSQAVSRSVLQLKRDMSQAVSRNVLQLKRDMSQAVSRNVLQLETCHRQCHAMYCN